MKTNTTKHSRDVPVKAKKREICNHIKVNLERVSVN